MLSLEKAASWAVSELLPAGTPGAEAHAARVRTLSKQISTWGSRAPKIRPSFAQLCADGSFIPFADIIKKSVPYCAEQLRAFEADPTPATAKALQRSVVLSSIAGDGRDPPPDPCRPPARPPRPPAAVPL